MDDFLADMRFLEPAWREAFRARVSGWLPREWIEEGVRKGGITVLDSDPEELKISDLGHRLTDLAGPSLSEDTIEQVAHVLVAQNWSRAWLSPVEDARCGLLDRSDMFPASYGEQILRAFDRASGASE